ncbi:DUF3656 domain-containing U32 family peptidase [Clostridium vincentii]|uniref:Putative protease YhbU n=1 Tax=Clostridium vincentii TaxID=52704 RepID=A0A2T0BG85_9CLOT|nr:U32 family peptidase [Clostridium vincentii]PRR82905.1 putative protease YhbU precursor [Clostridium vincentii]
MQNIELLAPAGSMQSLYAAINSGADAVYLGGSKFSARANASNFDNENIKIAVDYCHCYGVKIYVTMNTILKESELSDAIKYVGYLYEIGVDALIIQDLGLLSLIQENYNDFQVHASTQMTIHNGAGALYFKEKGFTRVILSRELALDEIAYISKDLALETEIFVHGALCVCYSGQCLMSSMIGGRSGNRGRCAQPCRMQYTLKSKNMGEKRGFLLSPKDVCTIDDIKDIIESGTSSLKIEGRMKRPEYVAGTVENYRKAIDKETENKKYDVVEGEKILLQLFNREGFSKAYLHKNVGKDMMSYLFPKNTGIQIGKAQDVGDIILEETIILGDGIRFGEKGFTLSKIIKDGIEVKEANRGDRVKLFPKEYRKGDVLFRTSSKALFDSLEDSMKPFYKKILLTGDVKFKIGESISITATYLGNTYEVQGDIVEKAEHKALDRERIVESLKKSGEYPYKIENIEFKEYEEGFIKISAINNLRRELFEKIEKEVTAKDRRRRKTGEKILKPSKEASSVEMLFTCTTKAQLDILIEGKVKDIGIDLFSREKDAIRIKDIDDISDVNLYILTPGIIKGEFNSIVNIIEKLKKKISGIITSNTGIINLYKDQLNVIGDYKLNIFNSQALNFAREDMGIVSLSLELNRREIKEIMKSKITKVACSIYGKTELMVSEYCPIGSTFGEKSKDKECNGVCMKDTFTLVDRMNESFKVMTDNYCRSHILNNVPLNLIEEIDDLKTIGVETFRVDFKDESSLEVKNVLDMLKGNYSIDGKLYTKGHYKRGVE